MLDDEQNTLPSAEDISNQSSDEVEKTSAQNPDSQAVKEKELEDLGPEESEEDEDDNQEDHNHFENLSLESLVSAFEKMLKTDDIKVIRNQVEQLRSAFESKYNTLFEEKKATFLEEGGLEIDFEFYNPHKKSYDLLLRDYKRKRNTFYKNIEQRQKESLNNRLELIEELKGLISIDQDINTTYKQFKDLQSRWKSVGAVPRAEANNVWRTYHHHVNIFYDFLHLNRELRELDYKHNFEEKTNIISQAEKLVELDDAQRAFRDLQQLHKRWKDELGPVAPEHREELWERFSELTKVIRDKRQHYLSHLEDILQENLQKKLKVIQEMESLLEQDIDSFKTWSKQSKTFEKLRDRFFELGKVPRSENSNVWNHFKTSLRSFNKKKNLFFRQQKKESSKNLALKKALIERVKSLTESDLETSEITTQIIAIQKEWKTIGNVGRRQNEKIWKVFRSICNAHFEQLDKNKNKVSEEELQNFEAKQKITEALNALNEKEAETAQTKIATLQDEWNQVGSAGKNEAKAMATFQKALEKAYKEIGYDKQKVNKALYQNKLNQLSGDEKGISKELGSLQRKIDETKSELNQLENNLQFFSQGSEDNPVFKKVVKDIENRKEILDKLKEQKKQLKQL